MKIFAPISATNIIYMHHHHNHIAAISQVMLILAKGVVVVTSGPYVMEMITRARTRHGKSKNLARTHYSWKWHLNQWNHFWRIIIYFGKLLKSRVDQLEHLGYKIAEICICASAVFPLFHVCIGPTFSSFFSTTATPTTIPSSRRISRMLLLKDSSDCTVFPIDVNIRN